MKFKMFMDSSVAAIEERINAWLEGVGPASIIKTDTVVTAVAEKTQDGTYPCVVVTVWYEPPSN
jgi:hypothetical protein